MNKISALLKKSATKWIVGLILLFMGLSYLSESAIGGALIILAAALVLPPAYRWLSTKLNRSLSRKVRLVLVFALCLVGIIVGGSKPSDNQLASKSPQPSASVSQEPTPTPTPESDEAVIRRLVSAELKGNSNMGKPKLRNLNLVELPDGWNVRVEFNSDDNLTAKFRKSGIEGDMASVYTVLYADGALNIQNVTISAFFPLVDRYGNESDGVVYKTSLSGSEASKVNWSANKITLQASILPKVWTVVLLHPDFQ